MLLGVGAGKELPHRSVDAHEERPQLGEHPAQFGGWRLTGSEVVLGVVGDVLQVRNALLGSQRRPLVAVELPVRQEPVHLLLAVLASLLVEPLDDLDEPVRRLVQRGGHVGLPGEDHRHPLRVEPAATVEPITGQPLLDAVALDGTGWGHALLACDVLNHRSVGASHHGRLSLRQLDASRPGDALRRLPLDLLEFGGELLVSLGAHLGRHKAGVRIRNLGIRTLLVSERSVLSLLGKGLLLDDAEHAELASRGVSTNGIASLAQVAN